MKISKNKKLSFSLVFLLGIGLVFGLTSLYSMDPSLSLLDNFKPTKPPVSLIPEDVTIRPDFVGGVEKRVGRVQKVQGKVYVIHKGDKEPPQRMDKMRMSAHSRKSIARLTVVDWRLSDVAADNFRVGLMVFILFLSCLHKCCRASESDGFTY